MAATDDNDIEFLRVQHGEASFDATAASRQAMACHNFRRSPFPLMDHARTARLIDRYPALAALDRPALDELLEGHAQWVDVPAGTILFDEGSPCVGFPLVVSGEMSVARGSASGRALELYRVPCGELCVVSTACLTQARPMHAQGVATKTTELVLLDGPGFEACCRTPAFRAFVFAVFGERLADLMTLVEAVAFQRLDQRLAAALLGHGAVLHATHQALADQLGTAREIVTRLLRRFERDGLVELGRERIVMLDAAALRAIAEPAA
jgi:CRP/FNR family transcriptional regulator